jgi:hypothetical protein
VINLREFFLYKVLGMICALQNKPFLVSRLRKEVAISILNRHIFRSVFPVGVQAT